MMVGFGPFELPCSAKNSTHSYCADEHDCCKSCDRYSTFSTVRPDYRSYMLLLCLPFLCALDTANSCTYECAQLMLNHNVVYLSKSTDTYNMFYPIRDERNLHARVQHKQIVS